MVIWCFLILLEVFFLLHRSEDTPYELCQFQKGKRRWDLDSFGQRRLTQTPLWVTHEDRLWPTHVLKNLSSGIVSFLSMAVTVSVTCVGLAIFSSNRDKVCWGITNSWREGVIVSLIKWLEVPFVQAAVVFTFLSMLLTPSLWRRFFPL